MGIYASNFHKNDGHVLTEITDPSQANWITIHAETCKMTVPEVQRCWSRFLMLQPDEKGNLPRTRFLQTNSPFSQKLLRQIPATDEDQITFQIYCNAVSWLSKSSLEIKLKGLFQTLTSGILGKEQLRDILQDLYPLLSHICIDELSGAFFKEVDTNNQGYITEDIFLAWVQSFPQEMVKSILAFPVIPPNLTYTEPLASYPSLQHLEVLPFWTTKLRNLRAILKIAVQKKRIATDVQDMHGLIDRQLPRVATEMATRKRNWKLLANLLGILETDSFHSEYGHLEAKDQILKMLQLWHRNCQEDSLAILQATLQQSGNQDIFNEVFSLSF